MKFRSDPPVQCKTVKNSMAQVLSLLVKKVILVRFSHFSAKTIMLSELEGKKCMLMCRMLFLAVTCPCSEIFRASSAVNSPNQIFAGSGPIPF